MGDLGAGGAGARLLSSVFERRTAILLRVLDERALGKNPSLVNFAGEIDSGRQGRRERIRGLDAATAPRRERLTKVAS